MVSRASSVETSGAIVMGLAVIQLETGWPAASKCSPRARTMSRSVKMPVRWSPSMTSAEPTCLPPMMVAASATVVEGSTVIRSRFMASPTVPMALRASLLATAEEANRDAAALPGAMRRALLAWYRPRRTAYPWRGAGPFGVLVSEVMLQQTQAARVAPRYVAFMERFPDVEALAAASRLGRGDARGFTQALMDLGREVCRPTPRCESCPLRRGCRFRLEGGRPERSPRRQASFEGSLRQVRGAVLARLREHGSASMASLSETTGYPPDRIGDAVRGLAADGVVVAGPTALAGRPSGRVRLPH